jgi:hypothetical protein
VYRVRHRERMPKSADKMSTPRVEVELKATRVCYLSNSPHFDLILRSRSYDIDERVFFLHDGFVGVEGYQPINSPRIIQCFDCETGDEVQVVHQGIQALFLDRVQYTSSSTRESYELPFVTSSLKPDRKYRLCFRSNLISYWPASVKEVLVPRENTSGSLLSASIIPPQSTPGILWEAIDGKDTVVFKTRSSQPPTPQVAVTLSAPSTYSLPEQSLKFVLTFSTNASFPFTAYTKRPRVIADYTDIKILDATSRSQIAPTIHVCYNSDEYDREEFLEFDGSYTEHRAWDFADPFLNEVQLKAGHEYIMSYKGERWWWTEDTLDEVLEYLASPSNIGLDYARVINTGASEVRFKVVE